jgi:ribosomal protein S12 methylthiotransferase
MALQEKISAERLRAKVGTSLNVLVDEVKGTKAVARSAADAPEIDGLVYVSKAHGLKVGDFAEVRIVKSDTHDLWAETVP